MEGVAFSLRDCRRTMDSMGLEIREIRLMGGGSKSKLWSRIICDVFNLPVVLPGNSDASFGSALLAGVGIGIFQDEHTAVKQCARTARSLCPIPENADLYDGLFRKYLQYHDALAPMYGGRG
jgi:xylulokinase